MKRSLLACLVGLVCAASTLTPAAAADTSPPSGCGAWMNPHRSPDQRADLVLAQMTIDEKVLMTHALSDDTHSRETAAIPRLCVPQLLLNNGPAGVGSGGIVQPNTTALPAPLGLAASFDPSTARG